MHVIYYIPRSLHVRGNACENVCQSRPLLRAEGSKRFRPMRIFPLHSRMAKIEHVAICYRSAPFFSMLSNNNLSRMRRYSGSSFSPLSAPVNSTVRKLFVKYIHRQHTKCHGLPYEGQDNVLTRAFPINN